MLPIPCGLPGAEVSFDLSSNCWKIRLGGQETYTLREWTWGERRQLVQLATVDGELDRGRFLGGLLELLLKPHCGGTMPLEMIFLSLHFLRIPEFRPFLSLEESELLLARSFGWKPSELHREPAAHMDDLIHQLAGLPRNEAARTSRKRPVPSPGTSWKSIIVDDSENAAAQTTVVSDGPDQRVDSSPSTLSARIDRMLESVAVWAGVAPPATDRDRDGERHREHLDFPEIPRRSSTTNAETAQDHDGLSEGMRMVDESAPFAGTARLSRPVKNRPLPMRPVDQRVWQESTADHRSAVNSDVGAIPREPGTARASEPPQPEFFGWVTPAMGRPQWLDGLNVASAGPIPDAAEWTHDQVAQRSRDARPIHPHAYPDRGRVGEVKGIDSVPKAAPATMRRPASAFLPETLAGIPPRSVIAPDGEHARRSSENPGGPWDWIPNGAHDKIAQQFGVASDASSGVAAELGTAAQSEGQRWSSHSPPAFSHSDLEETLADVLERAALEAGIDVP